MTTNSALRATIWAIFLVTFLTLVAELFTPLKETLALLFGHHWTGKGILAALLWIVAAHVANDKPLSRPTKYLICTVSISSVAIISFYLIHYFF